MPETTKITIEEAGKPTVVLTLDKLGSTVSIPDLMAYAALARRNAEEGGYIDSKPEGFYDPSPEAPEAGDLSGWPPPGPKSGNAFVDNHEARQRRERAGLADAALRGIAKGTASLKSINTKPSLDPGQQAVSTMKPGLQFQVHEDLAWLAAAEGDERQMLLSPAHAKQILESLREPGLEDAFNTLVRRDLCGYISVQRQMSVSAKVGGEERSFHGPLAAADAAAWVKARV